MFRREQWFCFERRVEAREPLDGTGLVFHHNLCAERCALRWKFFNNFNDTMSRNGGIYPHGPMSDLCIFLLETGLALRSRADRRVGFKKTVEQKVEGYSRPCMTAPHERSLMIEDRAGG